MSVVTETAVVEQQRESVAELATQLQRLNHNFRFRGVYSSSWSKKSDSKADSIWAASKQLNTLAEGLGVASRICQSHAEFFGGSTKQLWLSKIDATDGQPTLTFSNGKTSLQANWVSHRSRWEFVIDGKTSQTSSLDVMKETGCSSDYLQGITETLSLMLDRSELAELIASSIHTMKESMIQEQGYNNTHVWKRLTRHADVVKYLASSGPQDVEQQVEMISALERRRAVVGVCRASRTLIEKHNMPAVPGPQCVASCVADMEPFSGVYFKWVDGVCAYIGKSINVPSRLKNHAKVRPVDDVSYLRLDEQYIHTYELFYIWLMHPFENSECEQAEKALQKTQQPRPNTLTALSRR